MKREKCKASRRNIGYTVMTLQWEEDYSNRTQKTPMTEKFKLEMMPPKQKASTY